MNWVSTTCDGCGKPIGYYASMNEGIVPNWNCHLWGDSLLCQECDIIQGFKLKLSEYLYYYEASEKVKKSCPNDTEEDDW